MGRQVSRRTKEGHPPFRDSRRNQLAQLVAMRKPPLEGGAGTNDCLHRVLVALSPLTT